MPWILPEVAATGKLLSTPTEGFTGPSPSSEEGVSRLQGKKRENHGRMMGSVSLRDRYQGKIFVNARPI
ncbi:hypothetical protein NG791_17745 [Laspinema sp. D1]|nr:hypothetical protein [Laspinema sp. D2b]